MGTGIAQVAALAGHSVVLHDVSDDALEGALAKLSRFLRRGAVKEEYAPEAAEAAISHVRPTRDLLQLASCVLVIEAAPEELALKQQLFTELEALVATDAILATNTSSLSVSAISRPLAHPERVCGMHFFNPVHAMQLVEVIGASATDEAVLERVMAIARSWGKVPIRAADTPGFVVNRLARPFYLEGLRLLGDGTAGVETIDRLVRDGGFPMGPFELMDLIGIDISLAATVAVWEGFARVPRLAPHAIQRAMIENGRLGRKTRRGFYDYTNDAT